MDESQLIARVKTGDTAAERELYDAHVDRVYRLAFRMTGRSELAQDFTQDTFIRAFGRIDDFRGNSAFSTWLHRVATNVILNGLRKVRRFDARETQLEEASHVALPVSAVEPDLKDRMRQAIDALPKMYRIVFLMHDVEGYKHEEIAGALGSKVGTTKAQLSRARARLRNALEAFAGEYAS